VTTELPVKLKRLGAVLCDKFDIFEEGKEAEELETAPLKAPAVEVPEVRLKVMFQFTRKTPTFPTVILTILVFTFEEISVSDDGLVEVVPPNCNIVGGTVMLVGNVINPVMLQFVRLVVLDIVVVVPAKLIFCVLFVSVVILLE